MPEIPIKKKNKHVRREPATEITFYPAFVPHPGELGLPADAFLRPQDVDIESICGGIDDSQPVEQYDGTLGVTQEFVDQHQAPVGQIQWNDNLANMYTDPGNVNGQRWCSGTLISYNLFLTAGHCFDQNPDGWLVPRKNGTNIPISSEEIATNMHVNFNFQVDPLGNLRQEQSFDINQLLEHRLGGIDYAIVELKGYPGSVFSSTPISPTDCNVGDMVCIIGHPAGLPKRIEAGPVTDFHDSRIGYNDIDTLGGNSGSGIVLSPSGVLVGVHTNGGCDEDMEGHNHGQRISAILEVSPTLQNKDLKSPYPALDKWAAVLILIIGGATRGGSGIGIGPSGGPHPIDPHGPLARLSKDKRDLLIGLAATEMATIVNNSQSRLEIERAGLNMMSNAIESLRKSFTDHI